MKPDKKNSAKMNRFFVSKESFQGEQVALVGRQAHQVRNVLRMRPGDHITVLDNQGWEYDVVLTSLSPDEIVAEITQKQQATGEPNVQITLYQSLLTRDKFEWVLQKCTEIGVVRFVPVVTQRSLVRDADSITASKLERWRSIITEAAEQSRRGRIPELAPAINLGQALAHLGTFDRCLMATAQAQGVELRKCLRRGNNAVPANIALFIGPEGGFTDEEVQLCQAGGAVPISLGRRILRTETAAAVTASIILYELGEMEA